MGLVSRFQVCFQAVGKRFPAFKPTSRFLDFRDKGKAEENVYFKKEEIRLLEKLKKLIGMESSKETKVNVDKPNEPSNQKPEQKDKK